MRPLAIGSLGLLLLMATPARPQPPDTPEGLPSVGRAAIRAAYANGGGPLALRALAFATEGSVGYIIGAYGHEPGRTDAGKFVLALRQGGDGRWLIAADIDNSIHRPPPAPGPPG